MNNFLEGPTKCCTFNRYAPRTQFVRRQLLKLLHVDDEMCLFVQG